MNCRRVKKILVPFLEGELSERLKANVHAHLEICAHCQKEKELFPQSWQMLDSYVTPKLKDDFTASLMRRIHAEQAKIMKVSYRLPQFSFVRLAPVLAIVLVMVLISSLFWKKQIGQEKLVKVIPQVSQEAATTKQAVTTMPEAITPTEAVIPIETVTPMETVTPTEAVTAMADEEIIRDLDIYENIEVLENMELASEFDIVEGWEETTS